MSKTPSPSTRPSRFQYLEGEIQCQRINQSVAGARNGRNSCVRITPILLLPNLSVINSMSLQGKSTAKRGKCGSFSAGSTQRKIPDQRLSLKSPPGRKHAACTLSMRSWSRLFCAAAAAEFLSEMLFHSGKSNNFSAAKALPPLGEPHTCDGLLSQVLRGYQRQADGKTTAAA